MEPISINLVDDIKTRNSSVSKDAKLINGYAEILPSGKQEVVRRAGLDEFATTPTTGTPQLLCSYLTNFAIAINSTLYVGAHQHDLATTERCDAVSPNLANLMGLDNTTTPPATPNPPVGTGASGWTSTQYYSISGNVSGTTQNILMLLTGASYGVAYTDSSGNYTFSHKKNGNYTVTPVNANLTFTPTNQPVTISGSNVTGVNFTEQHYISGTITGAANVLVTLSGASSDTTYTDGSGNYKFTNLAAGSYTITPTKANTDFQPTSQNVTITNADITGINFNTYSISGTITGATGVTVTEQVKNRVTTTAGDGTYTLTGFNNGTYTVVPTKGTDTFTPTFQQVVINNGNQTGVNFVDNSADVIVGAAKVAGGGQNHAFRWTAGTGMVDIGTLGAYPTLAWGVSSNGTVVVGESVLGGWQRAFRWTAGTGMVDIGTLGGSYAMAYGVSADSTTIVGLAYTGTQEHAFRWTAGTGMVDLGLLAGGTYSTAVAASANGSIVVGYGDTGVFPHAFRWTAGTGMVDLGLLPGGSQSYAHGISSDGSVVVGEANTAINTHAFRWTAGTGMVDLGLLAGGTYSVAYGVSSDGSVVVGEADVVGGNVHAFRWTAGTGMVDIGLAGGAYSTGRGISTDGSIIVGQFTPTSNHAFRWTAGTGMVDLGTLGGNSSFAYAINRS